MEELRYQVDLLNALNQKLEKEEKMLKLICETLCEDSSQLGLSF